jgi:hypothetical protein
MRAGAVKIAAAMIFILAFSIWAFSFQIDFTDHHSISYRPEIESEEGDYEYASSSINVAPIQKPAIFS